jgi:hypothetical protein
MARHRYAIHDGSAADKAHHLRKRTQRPRAGGRRVDERTGDVISHHLVCCGVEASACRSNRTRRIAVFDPIKQGRQEIESVGRRAAVAVAHIGHRIESREVLRRLQPTVLVRHLLVVELRAENRRTRVTEAVIPDDLVPVVDELRDVERRRGGDIRALRVQGIDS